MAACTASAFDPAHVRQFTELIQALQVVLHITTAPGDAVAMHTPTYPPFLETSTEMGRRLVPIPMVRTTASGWTFDAAGWPTDVARHGCRAMVLVNPHNPTGRVLNRGPSSTRSPRWPSEHDLVVISDEIHSDLIYEPPPPHPVRVAGSGHRGRR